MTQIDAAPDLVARRARRGVSVVFAVLGALFASWAARIPQAQHRLGLSNGALAVALFGLACGSVLALVATPALLRTLGSRRCVLLGAVLLGGGLPATVFAPNYPVFILAVGCFGAGNGVLDVSVNAHAARWSSASAGRSSPDFTPSGISAG